MDLRLNGCLAELKTLASNSIDACVTDPPYFLANSSGKGFMGKEWDSLSVENAFVEAVLRSLHPVYVMGVENFAPEAASIASKSKRPGPFISALYVDRKHTGVQHKLSLGTFSVHQHVLTRAEVLALCRELSPSLTNAVESAPESVVYAARNLFTEKSPSGIARELALRLHSESLCEEVKTLLTLMADLDKNAAIEGMTGKAFEIKFIDATGLVAKSVESIVAVERYSATTLSPIESQKTIRWITSLPCVCSAMALFTANPGNIQLLSERFHYQWLSEVYRVLKPGGHILAFAGTRTYHRLVAAAELAGFEIRDQIQWLYGQGFPKSLDVSKAIDKAAGAEREVVGKNPWTNSKLEAGQGVSGIKMSGSHAGEYSGERVESPITAPATEAAKQWEGWGTSLKPANEPIVLARKPLEKGLTVAQNVQKWGTGAINIDACRIGTEDVSCQKKGGGGVTFHGAVGKPRVSGSTCGRFPANVILDEIAASALDAQTGELGNNFRKKKSGTSGGGIFAVSGEDCHSDTGGASRFFYCAKASTGERNAGLDRSEPIWKEGAWENGDLNSLTESISRLAKDTSEDILAVVLSWSTDGFGSNTTDQSRKDLTCITKITSKLITESKTWSCFQNSSTRESIRVAIKTLKENGLSPATSAALISQLKQNTTDEKTVSALGVVLAALQTLSKINAFANFGAFHPTIKPVKLMEYLVRLITPPKGICLDPFMGSGTTGIACKTQGFGFLGIEQNPEYFEIAKKRIENWAIEPKQEETQLELEA